MIRLVLSILLLLLVHITSAQVTVRGTVVDEASRPIAGAIVKVKAGDAVLAYAIADTNGHYSLTFTAKPATLLLTAEALGRETVAVNIANRTQERELRLLAKAMALKEVVVKAPSIREQGDTLSYNLSAFTSESDYTLKDAMKKLPGIDITETGAIKYMGKEISNFYIEGLNLLGGKYGIATNNIPADYVSSVEVLQNHQAVKMNKGIFSDNVAINIRLKERARLRPMGTYEAAAGYGDHLLWWMSGAGMLFKPDFQTIGTLKAGNIRTAAKEEGVVYFDKVTEQSNASKLVGNLSASAPPMRLDRYAAPDDRLLTFNFISKAGKDKTLRGSVGYGYARSEYEYSLSRSYYDGMENILIAQQLAPLSVEHKPDFSVEYRNNADRVHLNERLMGGATFLHTELPTIENGIPLSQAQSLHDYNLSNKLDAGWRRGKARWSVSSDLTLLSTPTARLSLSDGGSKGIVCSVQTTRLHAANTLQATFERGASRFTLPLLLDFSTEHLQTVWQNQTGNDVTLTTATLALSPRYEYTHPRRKYVFRADLPLRLHHIRQWYASAMPGMYLNYQFSGRSTLRVRTSYRRTFGDILDFLTESVQTDNTTMRVGSGVLADNRQVSASANFDYKIPLEMWFVNAELTYQHDRRNLISAQEVSSGMVLTSALSMPHASDGITTGVSVTKHIVPIKTKISLRGSYGWNRATALQNDRLLPYTHQSLSLTPTLQAHPLDFVELDYTGTFSKNLSRFEHVRNSYRADTHRLSLKLSPAKPLQLTFASDITRRQLTDDLTKTMMLLDCSATYRHKTVRLALDFRNVLNQKRYAYTIYNSINTYTYDYLLRGREVVLTLTYTR